MPPGRVTLYVATSADGYLADEDGGVEWLSRFEEGDDQTGYDEFLAGVDCLVMGSRTYEQVRGFGDWPYGDRPTYVFTARDLPRAAEPVEFVDGEVSTLAARLRREGAHVWLVGGADLARAFLRADEVDELRLTLVPVLLGGGLPLFADTPRRWLRLVAATTRASGLVELRYAVEPRRRG